MRKPVKGLDNIAKKAYIACIGTSSRQESAMTYTATMGNGASADFDTITEARAWATSFGDTEDFCSIATASGRIVGEHRRDPNGDGRRWYRGTLPGWINTRHDERAEAARYTARHGAHPIPDLSPRHR